MTATRKDCPYCRLHIEHHRHIKDRKVEKKEASK